MEIRDFYTDLIELASPWTVKSVAANEGPESVDVYLECAEAAQFACPHCNRACPVRDYSPPKSWRHLDTCRKMTFLHARLPIVDCPEHGEQHPRIPWADADSPFTAAFEKWIGALAESFGDPKKAAHFAGVEYVLVRRLLRRAASLRRRQTGGCDSSLAPAARLAGRRTGGQDQGLAIPALGGSPPGAAGGTAFHFRAEHEFREPGRPGIQQPGTGESCRSFSKTPQLLSEGLRHIIEAESRRIPDPGYERGAYRTRRASRLTCAGSGIPSKTM